MIFMLFLLSGSPEVAHFKLVEGGQSEAVLTAPVGNGRLSQAAMVLRRYIGEASGAWLPVSTEDARPDGTLTIGLVIDDGLMDRLGPDGFRIQIQPRALTISAATADGAEFGVYRFLERFLGILWLFPGEDGKVVPKHKDLSLPVGVIEEKPAFKERALSGLEGSEQWLWARRNGHVARMRHNHNMFKLFPPEQLLGSKLKFFPIVDGKLRIAADNSVQSWQPCFSQEDLVSEAVTRINAWFEDHPNAPFFSLAINDSHYFCECERCLAGYQGKTHLGDYRAANPYFRWANAVVERVLKTHPHKWFGALAYNELIEPPDFPVHPRIVPFLTLDRLKWASPDMRRDGLQLTRDWLDKTDQLGWYDYIYGTPYCVPRVYFHQMAANYRDALKLGVTDHYAEAYPNWGEGPKLWLAMKLQWDPNADVDKLLQTWLQAAVGPEAAPHLSDFYEFWEDYWTNRLVETEWFQAPGQYMWFGEPYYLDLLTHKDLDHCRALLDKTISDCKTSAQRKRARLIARAFDYYEASARSYLGLVKGVREQGKGENHYVKLNRKRKKLLNRFQGHPFLLHRFRMDRRKSLNLLDWENSDALQAHLERLAELKKSKSGSRRE